MIYATRKEACAACRAGETVTKAVPEKLLGTGTANKHYGLRYAGGWRVINRDCKAARMGE